MSELARYQVDADRNWRRFGSQERYNRVLFGGHNNERDNFRRFFTFAGDIPIFMGAASDCLKNNWCYQAKRGILQSGVALTPGVSFLPVDWKNSDCFSRWFHAAGDIVSTWHHGYMEYDLTHNSPWFPETGTNITIYPLQNDDGFVVHYDIFADGEIIFCAVLGGMTDYISRFDAWGNELQKISPSDFLHNQACTHGNYGSISFNDNEAVLLAGCDFGAELKTDGCGAAMERYPAQALLEHDGEKTVIKFIKHLAPGEHLCGNLVVLMNSTVDKLNEYLTDDPREKTVKAIEAKSCGIVMNTPDDRLDTTVIDQQIALDAAYHEPTFFHGAIGYHAPFLGWRGWYAGSLAGWLSRVRSAIKAHVGTMLQPGDKPERVWYDGAERPELDHVGTQLSHLENTYGRLTALLYRDDAYNMQEVATDMIFHYLNCSGDWALGAEIFDDLAEMLAWEERIFDTGNGLYQNFLNTWISDGHSYNGGGCAQSSFYNYAANINMAKLARKIGRDAALFEARAEKIFTAVNRELYLEERGVFAEFIDTLGQKFVHPSPELSTIYLASESGLATYRQMQRMLEFCEKSIRSTITLNRKGRLAYSSNWLPKKYSTCGIFPAENAALALAYFRNFRKKEALRLLDGLLDGFAMSISPGALAHVLTAHASTDMADLDFTDVSGTYLRLLVEGLWGVRFRRLDDLIEIAPQLPEQWDHAELSLTELQIKQQRQNDRVVLVIATQSVEQKVITLPGKIKTVKLSDSDCEIKPCSEFDGVQIFWPGHGKLEITYQISELDNTPGVELCTSSPEAPVREAVPEQFEYVHMAPYFNARITELFQQRYTSPRPEKYSIGVRIEGRYAWEWNHYGLNAINVEDQRLRSAEGGIFHLDSGWSFPTPAVGNNALCVSSWDNYPGSAEIPLEGKAREVVLFIFGSTNVMQSYVTNGVISVRYVDEVYEQKKLIHPENFDDFLVSATQQEFERFYWSNGCHGMVVRIKLDKQRQLAALKIEALANEVIIGVLGAVLVR